MSYFDPEWRSYVSMGERRRRAARAMARLRKDGRPLSPVTIQGRTIARTFWGKAWCENLERYSDYSNRLPRGRTYVRNGSVLDLQMAPGAVTALVSGSEIYHVEVKVGRVPKAHWNSIARDCAGAIDSLVELLQGRFSRGVMERVCRQKTGLFPAPAEIEFSCSCPDWASMCKHVAAVLYGIGARLDEQPELLFKLRQVDEKDLIVKAGRDLPLSKKEPAAEKILGPASADLRGIFGLNIAETADKPPSVKTKATARPARDRGARRATKVATKARPVAKRKTGTRSKAVAKSKAGTKGKAAVRRNTGTKSKAAARRRAAKVGPSPAR